MGLLSHKSETVENIEDQIKVLATNIEVLNQKLISDPNVAISPGEAIIKKQLVETIAKLEYVENFLRTTQNNLSNELLKNAKNLEHSFNIIQSSISSIPQERHALREEIKRLNEIITSISKLDKKWLSGLLGRLEILNKNAQVLNDNLVNFYQNLIDDITKRISAISEEASSKIFKSMVWFVIGIVVLSLIFTLIFTKMLM